jgi:hypothetical protein
LLLLSHSKKEPTMSLQLATPKREVGTVQPPAAKPHGNRLARGIAMAGVATYGLGMLGAMTWTAVATGEWLLTLLILPQALLAVTFGAGAMAGALLAPDPYVK